jgi:hypothetical protein
VGNWFGRIGLVWLLASVLTMIVLSGLVFAGARRRRLGGNGPAYVSFETPANVAPLSARSRERDRTPPEPVVTRRVTAESGALDRLLAGVQLPCDLEPLSVEGDNHRSRMAFVTYGYDAREVAVSVVDELERMGMDVEPLTYSEARAFRDGFEIAVTLYIEPSRVIRDRRIAFPGLRPDAVVLEFSVV